MSKEAAAGALLMLGGAAWMIQRNQAGYQLSAGPGNLSTLEYNYQFTDPVSRSLDSLFKGINTTVSPFLQGGDSVSKLLRFIGNIEAPQGYGQVYGGIPEDLRPKDLQALTVRQVDQWQKSMLAEWNRREPGRFKSTAAGRYQLLNGTLNDAANALGIWGQRFDVRTQDQIARWLLERRGLSDFQSGKITPAEFGNNLAKEWASLPVLTGTKTGQSYYDNIGTNSALVSPNEFAAVLEV